MIHYHLHNKVSFIVLHNLLISLLFVFHILISQLCDKSSYPESETFTETETEVENLESKKELDLRRADRGSLSARGIVHGWKKMSERWLYLFYHGHTIVRFFI